MDFNNVQIQNGQSTIGGLLGEGYEVEKTIGADKVIDYTHEDFTKNGERYDVIFDTLGRSSFSACKASLNKNGRYLLASFKEKKLLQMLWTSMFGGKKVICALSLEKPEDLVFIKKLIEDGKILQKVEKTVHFPLLIVVGDHELDLLQKTATAWHESEPVSEFHTISNAGHCANMDKAQEFNQILDRFIVNHR